MGNTIKNYGFNAGKIWKTLSKYGPLAPTTLIKKTGLNKEEFYTAIGWLAKENKICYNDTRYALGEDNWDTSIGQNAGKIWNILKTWEEIDENHLPKIAGISEKETYFAIGWLAKEGKISTKAVKPSKPQIWYELK